MTEQHTNFQNDIQNIGQIPIVAQLLDVICQTTGMGFAAIARVTEDRWIACSVRDDMSFGLKPGDELEIKTTICNEIREHQRTVVIDHASQDPEFRDHHTTLKYGFQSYISVPILRKDGHFFGTLCAIDPEPHVLSTPAVTGMFQLFAELISFHLNAVEEINESRKSEENQKRITGELEILVQQRTLELEEKNDRLEKMNKELQSFAYISSHDLQEPLRKIQTFAVMIAESELDNLTDKGKDYFRRMQNAAARMQVLINDLLAYSHAQMDERKFETVHLDAILQKVKEDLEEELLENSITFEITELCEANVIVFQFHQLLYNIISNSVKFSAPDQQSHIRINSRIESNLKSTNSKLSDSDYCHITISDNGIGFDPEYNEKIFELFQRLNNVSEYKGTGVGLAIVKKIVENHQGIITADGKLNEGVKFDIYIPAA